jgi:hypothetical protein
MTTKRYLLILFLFTGLQINTNAQSGQALDFVPTLTNYVDIGNPIPSGSYTREAWIYGRNFSFANNIFSGVNSAFWVPDGILRAGHFNGTIYDYWIVADPEPLLINTWYHVAITFEVSTNQITLFKNGVQVSQAITAGPYSENNLYIGSYRAGVHFGVGWDGKLDEVRLWNVVRTPAEIAASYNCKLTGDEPGLIGYYDFEQGIAGGNNSSETILFDRSDKCIKWNGTLTNFTLNGATSNWATPGSAVSAACGDFPNIMTSGNSLCILDGDNAASAADHTDFGSGTNVLRTFTIDNTGTVPLTISGINITGTGASAFSVIVPPASTVPAGGSTTFTVRFLPVTNGIKNATITINNNDGDEGSYDFAVQGEVFTLPVDLKLFTATKNNNRTKLHWITSSESNNRGFEIQRSIDGINWTPIGFVPGAGNSSVDISYNFIDATPQKGKNNYRLRQIDYDSREKFSEVRSVIFNELYTIVYPVPAADNVIIDAKDPKLLGTNAIIIDHTGKIVKQITMLKMQVQVSLAALPTGIYLLKMNDGSVTRLVKQ